MKKLLLLILCFCFIPLAYAQTNSLGYYPVSNSDESVTETETDTVVWTPASGGRIVLLGAMFSSDTALTWFVETGSTKVIPTTQTTASGVTVIGNGTAIWRGAADATLTYTTSIGSDHSILLWGYEY